MSILRREVERDDLRIERKLTADSLKAIEAYHPIKPENLHWQPAALLC